MNTTTQNTVNTAPSLWVGCLSCYNAGRLTPMSPDGDTKLLHHGGWVDAEYWDGAEPVCPNDAAHEEYEVMDTDNFSGVRVGDIDEAVGVASALVALEDFSETSNIDKALLQEILEDRHGSKWYEEVGTLDDLSISVHRDRAEWAAELWDDLTGVPEFLQGYIDWDAVASDEEMNGAVQFYGVEGWEVVAVMG